MGVSAGGVACKDTTAGSIRSLGFRHGDPAHRSTTDRLTLVHRCGRSLRVAMKQLNCWIDETIAERVETAAAQEDRSVSSWLRRLILRELASDDDSEPVGAREAA